MNTHGDCQFFIYFLTLNFTVVTLFNNTQALDTNTNYGKNILITFVSDLNEEIL